MATYEAKMLVFAQLPNSKGNVAVPGAGKTWLCHNIEIHNTNTTAETVVLNVHDGTNEYQIYKVVLTPNETLKFAYTNEGLVLANPAKITGSTTTASKVTIMINGSEVSA